MKSKSSYEHTFTGVCVYKRDRVFVNAVADDLAENNEDHALIFRWNDGQWVHWPIANAVGALCVIYHPTPKVLAMGINGEITVIMAPPYTVERVDDSDEGPSDLVPLKCIRLIGQSVYVAGMARHVYRRIADNTWIPIDQGVFVPRARRETAVGFNAIDGLRESSILAVGYKGEIWFFDGKRWIQQESPTNVALTCVRYLSDGVAYVAGMAGTLLRGTNDRWISIEQDVTSKDFWGMTVFKGKLYLANYDGIFVLEGDTLTPVEMRLPRKLTTAYLDANDNVIWSAGHKDLAYSDDGSTWVPVASPG